MTCPHCEGTRHRRLDGHSQRPVERNGVTFRQHQCLSVACERIFMSAQLVVTDEFEPVGRLASVLKGAMDESDARVQAEIEGAEPLETVA